MLADLYCEINIVHPFREGNGRTQRFFFEELIATLGKTIQWPNISQDAWVNANIAGYRGDLKPLQDILSQAVK